MLIGVGKRHHMSGVTVGANHKMVSIPHAVTRLGIGDHIVVRQPFVGEAFCVIAPGTGKDPFAGVCAGCRYHYAFMQIVVVVGRYGIHCQYLMAQSTLGGQLSCFRAVGFFCKEWCAKDMSGFFYPFRFYLAAAGAYQLPDARMGAFRLFEHLALPEIVGKELRPGRIAVVTQLAGEGLDAFVGASGTFCDLSCIRMDAGNGVCKKTHCRYRAYQRGREYEPERRLLIV